MSDMTMDVSIVKNIIIANYALDLDLPDSRFCSAIWLDSQSYRDILKWKINDSNFLSRLELVTEKCSLKNTMPANFTKFESVNIQRLEIVQSTVYFDEKVRYDELLEIRIFLDDGKELHFKSDESFYGALRWELR